MFSHLESLNVLLGWNHISGFF